MHLSRIVIIGGTGFGVLAMLLPFASFPIVGSVDGISADAWPALLPLMVVALLAVTGRWREGLGPVAGIISVIAAAAALVFAVVKLTDAVLAVRSAAGANLGPGALVLLVSVLVVLGGAAAAALTRS